MACERAGKAPQGQRLVSDRWMITGWMGRSHQSFGYVSLICLLLLLPSISAVWSAPAMTTRGCTYTIPPDVDVVDGRRNYAQVKPGDILCLPAGERGNLKLLNLQGVAGSPITVRNAGGKVRISGEEFLSGGIGIVNSAYLRVTGTGTSSACGAPFAPSRQECGIEIGPVHKGIKVDTNKGTPHHIEIDHVFIHDTSTVTRTRGIAIHPVEGQLISGFYVHHNYIRKTTAEGIYVGTEPNDRPIEVLGKLEDVGVSYNLIEEIEYDGIKVKVAVDNVKIHHNIIRNVGLSGTDNHDSGILQAFSVGHVYNNYVENSRQGIRMGRDLEAPGTHYFNNVVVGADVGIVAEERDAQIYNNTVVGNGTIGIRAPGVSAKVFDNIVVGMWNITIEARSADISNNLIGSLEIARFVNPVAGNYRLQATSPAVDQGRASGVFPAYDYDDAPRPYGPFTDLGAYECRCLSALIHKTRLPIVVRQTR